MSNLDSRSLVRRLKKSESLLTSVYSDEVKNPLWCSRLSIHEELLNRSTSDGLTKIEEIRYGFSDSPFGICRIELDPLGILCLDFIDSPQDLNSTTSHTLMNHRWPGTKCLLDQSLAKIFIGDIFSRNSKAPLSLHLRGSSFQLKIWHSLLTIPESYLLSYAQLAALSGCPGAARAVGSALASNPIGYLIPCHRVLRADGKLGGFKWGVERKMAILAYEAALRDI